MKGKMTFLIKGIYLILVIIIISIVSFLIIDYNRQLTSEAEEFDLRTHATEIMDILSGSEKCLALQDVANIQGESLNLSYNRVIDLNKLEEFSSTFSEYEPDYGRDFKYRYKIKIETQPINIKTKEVVFESHKECRKVCYQSYVLKCYWVCDVVVEDKTKTIDVAIPKESWTFGVDKFSRDKALKERITVSTPVIVYYNKSQLMPAILWIDVVDGELERFANKIDESCLNDEKISSDLYFSYPVYEKTTEGKNYLCMKIKETVCQRLACKKEIEFEGIKAPGNYKILIKPGDTIKVMV